MAHLSPQIQVPGWIIYTRHGYVCHFAWWCGHGRSGTPTPQRLLACYSSGHPLSLSCKPCVAAVRPKPCIFQKCVFYGMKACFLVGIYLFSEITWRVFNRIHGVKGQETHSASKWIALHQVRKNKEETPILHLQFFSMTVVDLYRDRKERVGYRGIRDSLL